MLKLLCSIAVLTVLWPKQALAWGFGVHLQLGQQLLRDMSALPAHLQQLLAAFPNDFLYGCISADITLGKKHTHYLKHCHSWNTGRQLLDNAANAAQRACAYGYLSHLAADTIAHAYMVPFKTVRSYSTLLLNHQYWELRFEAQIPAHQWRQARLLARHDFTQHDELLQHTIATTLFSFDTNKKLFNSMLLISRIRRWRKLLRAMDSHSSWQLTEQERREYLELAATATTSVLSDENSPYLNADPSGERALYVADQLRANLNALWLDGKVATAEHNTLLAAIKNEFRAAVTEPARLLNLLAD